jgi:hypothetical protein
MAESANTAAGIYRLLTIVKQGHFVFLRAPVRYRVLEVPRPILA